MDSVSAGKPNKRCPNCGYCPHCGQARPVTPMPYYPWPWQPYYVPPWVSIPGANPVTTEITWAVHALLASGGD